MRDTTFTLKHLSGAWVLLLWMMLCLHIGCDGPDALDAQLATEVKEHGLRSMQPAPAQPDAKVELGRVLFFDRVLSGNRDVACATCHHPDHAMGDGRPLSVGVGGVGLGPHRTLATGRTRAPRNAAGTFNLHDTAWRTQFWDGRVEVFDSGSLSTPAQGSLPQGLDNLAAVQAMFPVTSRDEMRGERGDVGRDGASNELAQVYDSDMLSIWEGITARLLAIPAYRDLFASAYPEVDRDALNFTHAANAIAAFEIEAFAQRDAPWDRYLRGEYDALSARQKRGALLFFGQAQCGTCHTGALLSDQRYYNLGVPVIGPGKRPEEPLDYGRGRVTMFPAERYQFRTPPLRNVAATAPYMHNGAYATLEQAIRHHIDPVRAYDAYDGRDLPEDLRDDVHRDDFYREEVLGSLAPEIARVPDLTDAQIGDLVAFLEALTSPSLKDLGGWVPTSVPSGLPVD